MQWLAALCVRRPVFTWVLVLSLVVIGVASLRTLGVDRFPKIDFPVVVITTQLPGGSPEQVETEISDKIEASVNSISGLETLRSVSYQGLSVVTAQFVLDKDATVAAQDVRDRVNRVIAELPRDAEQPQVLRIDPDAAPVLLVAVDGPGKPREVTDIANRIVRRALESVSGVGSASVLGGRAPQIRIEADPIAMATYGLTVADLERAVASENVDLPGGNVVQGPRSRLVRVEGRIDDAKGFANIAVTQRDGAILRVSEVASVDDAAEIPSSETTLSGEPVVLVSVAKQSGTNTVEVVDTLRARIESLGAELPPGYSLRIVRDESEFIRNAIHAVEEHLVLGSICVAIVVLLFLLDIRATAITALAVPASIVATFGFVAAAGLTLNTLTLLALTLAVGIVIDDAIVVLENIVRTLRAQKERDSERAAVQGTREIGLAVLATTFSLVAVFLPIAFMGGIVGRFLRSFGLTMSFAVVVSLLVSFTLTPMLCARWLAPAGVRNATGSEEAPAPSPPEGRTERDAYLEWQRGEHSEPERGVYARIEQFYVRILAFCMRRRFLVGAGMFLALATIVPLAIFVPKNFLPPDDESRFEIYIRTAEGTSLDATRILADRVARSTRDVGGVRYTVVTVGSPPGDPSGRGPNEASVFVALAAPENRAHDQQEIITRVRRDVLPRFLAEGTRALVTPVNVFGAGGTQSATIQYVLRGPDLDRLAQYSNELLEKARHIPGVVEPNTTLIRDRPALAVRLDRGRAADLGVTATEVANTVRVLVGGETVATFERGGEEYDVRLVGVDRARSDPDMISTMFVPGRGDEIVQIGSVADVHPSKGPASIERLSRQRQVTLYANVAPGASEAAVIADLAKATTDLRMPPAYHAELIGRSRELGRAGQSFATAFLLSLAFMYLVLAAQFESWALPVAILVALPMCLPFALLSLVVLGQSINIFSALGILVLFGVIKKNGILQIDHIRALRAGRMSRPDAIMLGNKHRLRPILMTTLAFVAGMVPLALSSGTGAATNRAMASVIIGGQTLALVLTLVVTPVVYSWLDDLVASERLARIRRRVIAPLTRITHRIRHSGT